MKLRLYQLEAREFFVVAVAAIAVEHMANNDSFLIVFTGVELISGGLKFACRNFNRAHALNDPARKHGVSIRWDGEIREVDD